MLRPLLLRVDDAATWHDLQRRLGGPLPVETAGLEWALAADAVETLHPTSPPQGIVSAAVRCLAVACVHTTVAQNKTVITLALELASSLGANLLNVAIPRVGGPQGARFDRYQDALNFAHSLLHSLRLEAEARGVALALEAPSNRCLHSPVELRELIDDANSSAVGVCLDLEAASRFTSLEDWLTTLGPRIHSLRLSTDPDRDRHALEGAPPGLPKDRPLIARNLETIQQFSKGASTP